jgi:hypothetical protein
MDFGRLAQLAEEASQRHRALLFQSGEHTPLEWRPAPRPQGSFGIIDNWVAVGHGSNPDVVFAATSTGLWRHSDVTDSWKQLFFDDCLDVALDPQDSSIIYLGVSSRGVFKSFTSGDEWTTDPILAFDPVAAAGS